MKIPINGDKGEAVERARSEYFSRFPQNVVSTYEMLRIENEKDVFDSDNAHLADDGENEREVLTPYMGDIFRTDDDAPPAYARRGAGNDRALARLQQTPKKTFVQKWWPRAKRLVSAAKVALYVSVLAGASALTGGAAPLVIVTVAAIADVAIFAVDCHLKIKERMARGGMSYEQARKHYLRSSDFATDLRNLLIAQGLNALGGAVGGAFGEGCTAACGAACGGGESMGVSTLTMVDKTVGAYCYQGDIEGSARGSSDDWKWDGESKSTSSLTSAGTGSTRTPSDTSLRSRDSAHSCDSAATGRKESSQAKGFLSVREEGAEKRKRRSLISL